MIRKAFSFLPGLLKVGFREFILFLPIIAAIAFVVIYSSPLPLTDEWIFVRNAAIIHETNWFSGGIFGLFEKIWSLLTLNISVHIVMIPFFVWFPLQELFNYDARIMIGVTLFLYWIQLIVFRKSHGVVAWASLPVALVLFNPAHYMEFMWGFQFTLAMSITFPIVGLGIIERVSMSAPYRNPRIYFFLGLLWIFLGIMSSGGAIFALPAAFFIVAVSGLNIKEKLHFSIFLAVIALFVVAFYPSGAVGDGGFNSDLSRNTLFILTALGSVLVGSPVSITSFSIDARSIIGLSLVLQMLVIVGASLYYGKLRAISLPLSVFLFGILTTASIALGRDYLGNWHLQYAVPAVYSIYWASYCLYQSLQTVFSRWLLGLTVATLSLALIGFFQGFNWFGPSYRTYVESIESYVLEYEVNPDAPRPFPNTGWNLDARMVNFLKDQGHRLFIDQDRTHLVGSSVQKPLILEKIGPTSTLRGEKFNIQPHGGSALWAEGQNFTDSTIIVFDTVHLFGFPAGRPDLISTPVPDYLVSSRGELEVYLFDKETGARSRALIFSVK